MNTDELEQPSAVLHAPARTGTKQILLIEDDLHVAETFAELLELEGYRVTVVHDATAGLEMVRRQSVIWCCAI